MADIGNDKKSGKKRNDLKEKILRDIKYTNTKTGGQEDELDELEFISEETVKDKSRMAEGDPIHDEFVTEKKTRRRGVDEFEAKREKSLGFFKKYIPLIAIVCLAVIVVAAGVGTRIRKQKKEEEAKVGERPISEQEYEKDEHEDINKLIASYYDLYAKGDVENLQKYAYPMTDKEKSYIAEYSKYIDSYENITCYTKAGEDEKSFIVSVALEIRFRDVETPAPGLDFFYVRTADDGSVYIDNTYSTFNLLYKENPLDENVEKLITDYQAGEDVVALQASVQTQYEEALNQDENLKKMLTGTVTDAIAVWERGQQAQDQQAKQEAEQQVKKEEEEDAKKKKDAEKKAAEEKKKAKEKAAKKKAAKEKASKKWLYATDNVYVRKKASKKSKVVASVTKGDEVRQLSVTKSGWSKIRTGKIEGYIKSEYLTAKKTSAAVKDIPSGKRITLNASVNIRKSMSTSSDRIGLAYSGEVVTVVMSYDEGWTKVEWNDKTGYVRTDVLAEMQ